ncbi:MAG: SGNH/GDSL hydrolase family protein [Planctomyces sp.]|nr:SGNH/GDSL hydrolase family protein [Planctomyces sp.]
MSTTEAFNTTVDQLLDSYNATYAPLYGSTTKLRVSSSGRVYGTVQGDPGRVRLITIDPASGDFTLTLNLVAVTNGLTQLRVRFCANATDQACHEIFGNADTSFVVRTLNSAGSVVTTHASTNFDDSVNGTLVITRVTNTFTVRLNGTTMATFTDASLANGIVVYGCGENFVSPSATAGYQLTQINSGAPTEICPGICSLGTVSGTSVVVSTTAATRGTGGTLNYTLQRTTDITGASGWADVDSPSTSLTRTDTTVVGGTTYAWRIKITDGTNTDFTGFVVAKAENISTFNFSASQIGWFGRFTDSAGNRILSAKNSEVWFRVSGYSLRVWYVATGTAPLWVSVDGGAWYQPAGAFVNTSGAVAQSGEIFSGTPSDGPHDVRFRLTDANTGSFRLRLTTGLEVRSGSTPALNLHSDYGDYEQVRGSNGLANWVDTFTDSSLSDTASYTSPIFPGAQSITNGNEFARNSYCEFLVDSSVTKMYIHIANSGGGQDGSFGLWVNNVLVSKHVTAANTNGAFGLFGPITIPGTGTRLVRVSSISGLDGVVVNGLFVDSPVPGKSKTKRGCWVGDSVTAGDSVTTAFDPSGNFDQLCEIVDGRFISYNRGLSGQKAADFNGNNRQNDIPTNMDFVVCNMSINDAGDFAASPAATRAVYVTMYNSILTRCPNAKLLCVPQLPYQPTNRTAVLTGIQGAVADVNNPRCIYVSSDTWVSGFNEGSHPYDMGKAQMCGGGVAAIRIAAQPSDGDTITINGTAFEFDSNSSVIGGRTAVTIGATLVDTINNLANAIDADAGAFSLLQRIIIPTDTTRQGVAISGCTSLSKSGANITTFGPEAQGFLTAIQPYLLTDLVRSQSGLLLGVC